MPDELVEVYVAEGQLEATLLQSLLEAHGIPAMTTQESLGVLYTLSASRLGEVKLLVPSRHRAAAEALISDYQQAQATEDPDDADDAEPDH